MSLLSCAVCQAVLRNEPGAIARREGVLVTQVRSGQRKGLDSPVCAHGKCKHGRQGSLSVWVFSSVGGTGMEANDFACLGGESFRFWAKMSAAESTEYGVIINQGTEYTYYHYPMLRVYRKCRVTGRGPPPHGGHHQPPHRRFPSPSKETELPRDHDRSTRPTTPSVRGKSPVGYRPDWTPPS